MLVSRPNIVRRALRVSTNSYRKFLGNEYFLNHHIDHRILCHSHNRNALNSTYRALTSSPPAKIVQFRASEKRKKDGQRKHATLYTSDSASWTSSKIEKENANIERKDNISTKERITRYVEEDVIAHFLPAEYPNSVAPGYRRFASLCFCASVCGSAAMVLSTQTLLLAVGVVGSSQQASVMAGALNWVLKDGIGQLGGVWFASHMGRAGSGRFDADPKRWRMVAALSLDAATLMEIFSPLVPSVMVLPIASIANIGKNIGFLTASASRAALHQSLAISGNLADVTAKAGSQSLGASLLGTALGIGLSPVLETVPNFALGFVVLSAIHQGCNYASLKAVPLVNLNRHRLHLALVHYVDTLEKGNAEVLSPAQVAEREFFLPLVKPDDAHLTVKIGSDLKTVCPGGAEELRQLRSACLNEQYIVNTDGRMVHLVFLEGAEGIDLIRGMFHAYLIRANHNGASSAPLEEIAITHKIVDAKSNKLVNEMEKLGWKMKTEFISIESFKSYRLGLKD